ncbi:tagaturonate reductase [Vibrio scophthalmi]|uniref:tagaturonate reductase n=1 Tax=Vibrio scophthalmi TaxID=45658 RepID=UPI002FEF190B
MKTLNRTVVASEPRPTKILQFGEGNFLRAFVDWQIDLLNERTSLNAGITVVRPIDTDFPPSLNTQQGLYTTLIRGLDSQGKRVDEQRVVTSVNDEISAYHDFDALLSVTREPELRFVFSNTTEAGIAFNPDDLQTDAPPSSFPAKLTRVLLERFEAFNGDPSKGLILIPCELIDYNGDALKQIIKQYIELWQLPDAFALWLDEANTFCSTLVDRIVTGYPKEEVEHYYQQWQYRDQFVVSAENFYLFVIQGPESLADELCLNELAAAQSLNIKVVPDIKPYKERKVAILNGAHTALVPVAYLAGIDTVGDSMADELITRYLDNVIFEEIIPTLSLPRDELVAFANDVKNRFKNPYIRHLLLSISLNSLTKFKTRILPQLLAFTKQTGTPPAGLTFALAALIVFYRGRRGDETIALADDQPFLDFFTSRWADIENGELQPVNLVTELLAMESHWQHDLTLVPQLVTMTTHYVEQILALGMRKALENSIKETV